MVVTTSDEKTFDFATAMAIARSVFSLCQRRVEKGRPLAWDHVNLGSVVAGVINGRDDFTVDEVRRGVELGIDQFRSMLNQPGSIALSGGLEIELRPSDEDDRILIAKNGLGHTVVTYTDKGLFVDAYPEDQIDAVGSIRIGLDELEAVSELRR
jgi:hypothetical protein